MFARSTTMIAGTSDLEAGLQFARDEVWPTVQAMDGCVGFSLMVERETGRMITTSAWQSLDAMKSSASAVVPLRDRADQLLSAADTRIEEWEIASMHRDHHTGVGTCVRAAWSRVPAQKVSDAIEFYKFVLLPDMQGMPGFCSASLMVDRAAGRGVTSVAFDSREAMESSRDQADYLRGISTQEVDVEFLDVAEFELELAHLHVPELV